MNYLCHVNRNKSYNKKQKREEQYLNQSILLIRNMPCHRHRTWHPTLSQYTDTGPPCRCAFQTSHWNTQLPILMSWMKTTVPTFCTWLLPVTWRKYDDFKLCYHVSVFLLSLLSSKEDAVELEWWNELQNAHRWEPCIVMCVFVHSFRNN